MEHGDIEHALEDLESRMERLRSLYEQYFMGIEKLEPLIVRKDVERRMQVLRREQIRNTALRFKFQMLIQRYNTLQQYWARITREIETGTYRRDVMRAAARFGEKQALTILGRRRAEKYAALAEAQKARSENRRNSDAASDEIEEIEADLDDEPDVANPSTQRSHHILISEIRSPPKPGDVAPRAPVLAISPPPLRAGPPTQPAGDISGSKPAAASPATPGTTKQRVAELAAQIKAQRAARNESAPPVVTPSLDLDFTPSSRSPNSRRSSPSSRRERRSRSKLSEPPSTGPLSRSPTSRRARSNRAPPSSAAIISPSPLVAPPPSRKVERREPQPPAAEQKPGRPRPASQGPAAALSAQPGDSGLADARLRQIYAKYVETKRSVKESTAGVTFEKLAESLRTQAAKLRSAHPTKSIDYEVVVKDGKTLLKPIIR